MKFEFDKTCRVCLGRGVLDIFISDKKLNTTLSEMLAVFCETKPLTNDPLPKRICKICSRKLKKCYTFSDLCKKSEKHLTFLIQNQSNDIKDESLLLNDDSIEIKDEEFIKKLEENVAEECLLLAIKAKEENVDELKLEKIENDNSDTENWDAEEEMFLGELKTKKVNEPLKEISDTVEPVRKKRGRKPNPDGACKKPHQCDICGKFISTKSNLKAHKLCHTDVRPYKCEECEATFRGYSALFQHKKTHSRETPYHCAFCPKKFSRRTGLVNHTRIHTGEKKYQCDLCSKKFTQTSQLNIHMLRHKGDKSFLCSVCGKGFPIKSELRVHQRIHNGEKPYSCPMCPKSFATSGNLSIHVRIHKNEIRYHCKECSRGFVTHSSYAVHVKRHKGQRDYLCECGKSFYTSSALKQHRVVHTGEKKYSCKICQKTFSQTSHRTRHFKRDHVKHLDTYKSPHFLQKFDVQLSLVSDGGKQDLKCEN